MGGGEEGKLGSARELGEGSKNWGRRRKGVTVRD